MIKGLTVVRPVADAAVWERLGALLSAIGFEPGRGWADETGRGSAWLAPLGNLELVTGRLPAVPELLVECTAVDSVHAAVAKWAGSGESTSQQVSEVEATHWKSRMFTLILSESASQQVSKSASVGAAFDHATADPAETAFADAGHSGLRIGFWERDALPAPDGSVEGDLTAADMRFGVVVARWNAVITERLLQGAVDAIVRSGGSRDAIAVVRVPGAWEVPAAARMLAEQRGADGKARFDAIVTLGCLLRGETAHYEAIYNEAARGIGQSQQETGVPHGFGILTCETLEQALNRAGVKAGNKGFEAASAAMEMVSLKRKLSESAKSFHEHAGGGVAVAREIDALVAALPRGSEA